jgi:hypothetical protein
VSLAQLFTHQLVIERLYQGWIAGTPPVAQFDEYGQPIVAWVQLATVKGSVQPKSGTEVVNQLQSGATVINAIVYLLPTDVLPADRVRRADQANGPWYELLTVRDAAGRGHHLECDARLVV